MTNHNHIQRDLVSRLKSSGRYDTIDQNIEYKVDGIIRGELDVIAYTGDDVHIYEVKSNRMKIKYATIQLQRFHDLVHPMVTPKYIFHSPKKTKRLYI